MSLAALLESVTPTHAFLAAILFGLALIGLYVLARAILKPGGGEDDHQSEPDGTNTDVLKTPKAFSDPAIEDQTDETSSETKEEEMAENEDDTPSTEFRVVTTTGIYIVKCLDYRHLAWDGNKLCIEWYDTGKVVITDITGNLIRSFNADKQVKYVWMNVLYWYVIGSSLETEDERLFEERKQDDELSRTEIAMPDGMWMHVTSTDGIELAEVEDKPEAVMLEIQGCDCVKVEDPVFGVSMRSMLGGAFRAGVSRVTSMCGLE